MFVITRRERNINTGRKHKGSQRREMKVIRRGMDRREKIGEVMRDRGGGR